MECACYQNSFLFCIIKMHIFIFLLLSFLKSFECINFDINFPIIYDDPDYFQNEDRSYFGYSVILYPGDNNTVPWIQIGSPKGNSYFRNSGVIFRCQIGKICEKISIGSINDLTIKEDSWLGASMDIDICRKTVVVCAPRWKSKTLILNYDYAMEGACYLLNVAINTNSNNTIALPTFSSEKAAIENDKYIYYWFGLGQAGFHVHFSYSKEDSELLIGAPGVWNWMGISMLYRGIGKYNNNFNEQKHLLLPKNTYNTLQNYYRGYAVHSGYFSKNKLFYVAGSSRGKKTTLNGAVYVFEFDAKEMDIKQSIFGTKTGECFGSALAAADINGDGYDDLIIGAPYYSDKTYNEGKVYIYFGYNNPKAPLRVSKPPECSYIIGKEIGGVFGSAITNLGDIDSDGYADIAISAPYENDLCGVVYIFRGSKFGIQAISQKIFGKMFNLKGFGISISKPADIDGNGWNDIAIGAHLSGNAVILRGQPIVTLKQSLKMFSEIKNLTYGTKRFTIQICNWMEGKNLPQTLAVTRILRVDSKQNEIKISSAMERKIIKISVNKICENVVMEVIHISNDSYPIKIISESLLERKAFHLKTILIRKSNVVGNDEFCKNCPILNITQNKALEILEVPIDTCKDGSNCVTDLFVEVSFLELQNKTYVMDSKSYLTMNVAVENNYGTGYMRELKISISTFVGIKQLPKECFKENLIIICLFTQPILINQKKNFSIIFDINNYKIEDLDYEHRIYFNVTVSTYNKDVNISNNNAFVELNLLFDVNLTIARSVDNYTSIPIDLNNDVSHFTQLYNVEKFGISKVRDVLVEILFPRRILINKRFESFVDLLNIRSNFDVKCNPIRLLKKEILTTSFGRETREIKNNTLFNKSNLPFELEDINSIDNTYFINCTAKHIKCSKIKCSVGPYNNNQTSVGLELDFLIHWRVLLDMLKTQNVIQFTSDSFINIDKLNTLNPPNAKFEPKVTTVFLVRNKISIKFFIIPGVVGILVLKLLLICLCKAGFFERSAKTKLEALRRKQMLETFESGRKLSGAYLKELLGEN